MTEDPALDLARRAFKTATADRAIEHIAVCLTIGKIAWEASGHGADEAAIDAAEDAIAFDKPGATRAAARELSQLPREDAEAIFTHAQQKVGEALLLTANALMTTYVVLGGTLEDALGLDAEHVALAGTLALLSGADELYDVEGRVNEQR